MATPTSQPQLIIISGRSGSGKSTALHVLEDMGFYCIDNLPVSLLVPLVGSIAGNSTSARIGVGVDARNSVAELELFPDVVRSLEATHVKRQIVYLDSAGSTLVKRFSETRRKHPLSNVQRGLREALEYEKQLLEPIFEIADLFIDTTTLTLNELRDLIRERVVQETFEFSLLFTSFGYKNGVPVDADLVFDVRCLPNPHWKPTLRARTGLDREVVEFLEKQEDSGRMFEDIVRYLEAWLPKYEENNRSYITIALGCTGGQHRSVYLCQKLFEYFATRFPNVQVKHRELG